MDDKKSFEKLPNYERSMIIFSIQKSIISGKKKSRRKGKKIVKFEGRKEKKSSVRSEKKKNDSIRSIFSAVKKLEDVQRSASPPVLTG